MTKYIGQLNLLKCFREFIDTDDESSESSSSSSDEIELTDLCPTAVAELMAGKPTATAKVHTIEM